MCILHLELSVPLSSYDDCGMAGALDPLDGRRSAVHRMFPGARDRTEPTVEMRAISAVDLHLSARKTRMAACVRGHGRPSGRFQKVMEIDRRSPTATGAGGRMDDGFRENLAKDTAIF